MDQKSTDTLTSDLRRLGVLPGDVLMVHASMRAIGEVEGRAEGVVRALEMAVDADGTVLMNLGARDDWDWVNERPENERAALLAGATPFDCFRTPADPDNGVLAEVFRQMPGTLVNDHPDARFGARGKSAPQILEHLPWNDYYGPGSILERFVEADGKVLRLGADLDSVTLLHYAEYLTSVASKRRVRRHHLVLGALGPEVRSVECLDDSDGIVDYPGDDYFGVIMRDYFATGGGSRGIVGHASSELIESNHLVNFAVKWMKTHLQPGARSKPT
jgi:aminoglycoside N3'-acetyltransferase